MCEILARRADGSAVSRPADESGRPGGRRAAAGNTVCGASCRRHFTSTLTLEKGSEVSFHTPQEYEQFAGTGSGPRATFGSDSERSSSITSCSRSSPSILTGLKVRRRPDRRRHRDLLLRLLRGGPTGQTVGKSALGIRVISLSDDQPIGYGRALIQSSVGSSPRS